MQNFKSSFLLTLGALAFLSTSSVNGKTISWKPTFVTSKNAVQEGESLQFSCTGFTYTNKTAVSFFSNDLKLFDSVTNKTQTGVTKVNSTSIILSPSFISKIGLTKSYCVVNSTSSTPKDVIPYISKINISLIPTTFKVGTPFNVTCNLNVLPTSFAYNVTFERNGKDFGLWARDRKTGTWAWANSSAISGGSVAPGVKQPTPFSVVITPKNKDAAGKYRCSAVIPIWETGKSVIFKSAQLSNDAAAINTSVAFISAFVASLLAMIR